MGEELPLIRAGETICAIETLSDGSSLKFRVLEGDRPMEAFLIRFDGEYYAYKNRCAHMALTLDLDDNDFFTIDFRGLICKTHGAVYYPDDGLCISGPCLGESLEAIPIEVRDNSVLLAPTPA
jgi:nitrite reductase/ring-hydroxylating ferredoxin subunit